MAAAQYVMPICWICAENGRPLILGNGSAFVVDPGGGPFLVTAHHVYVEFCAARAARADTVCILDDLTKFPLDQRLIASDPVYDVATFKITADELVIHLQYGLSFPFDRMYELRELLKHLDGHVADGLGKHVKGIERKIGKPIRIQGGNISESVPKAGDSRLT